jgi:serine/threonine protein kinase
MSSNNEPSYNPAQLIADRYQILTSLGGGITSEVYKVRDLVTGQDLALKITKPGISHDDELALNREFYHLSRFTHPNIVSVVNFGTGTDGRRYFTMEYFDGKPFNEFFRNGYTPALIPAMLQVLQALDAIHCQLLCHCDVKPQNILVAAEGDR